MHVWSQFVASFIVFNYWLYIFGRLSQVGGSWIISIIPIPHKNSCILFNMNWITCSMDSCKKTLLGGISYRLARLMKQMLAIPLHLTDSDIAEWELVDEFLEVFHPFERIKRIKEKIINNSLWDFQDPKSYVEGCVIKYWNW